MTSASDGASESAGMATVAGDSAASMPVGDWQFWAVSLAAIVAVAFMIRPLLPGRAASTPCSTCGHAQSRPRRTELTVEGEAAKQR